MKKDPQNVYRERVKQFYLQVEQTRRQANLLASFRLLAFLTMVAVTGWLVYLDLARWSWMSIIVGSGVFLVLVRQHIRKQEVLRHFRLLLEINENELKIFRGELVDLDCGEELEDPQHDFSSDLDLFNKAGFFAFLNRTGTFGGRKALADALKKPLLRPETIKERQEAVEELSHLLAWRQDFLARAKDTGEKRNDLKRIRQWMNAPVAIGAASFWGMFIYAMIAANLVFLGSMITGWISFTHFLLWLLVPLTIAGSFARQVSKAQAKATGAYQLLTNYGHLFRLVEEEKFRAKHLTELQKELDTSGHTASTRLGQLAEIIGAIDQRNNVLAGVLLNAFVLWDLLQMRRLRKWQLTFQEEPNRWFSVMAHIEVLNSLATLRYNDANMTYPQVGYHQPLFSMENGGHPLIPAKERVENDFDLNNGQFSILTGANMAGKSTFLRTIGINIILAHLGAPVAAKRFRCQPLWLFSSMRTTDSLASNSSYFHSELVRLRKIVDALSENREGQPFIILDEILKGTNSKDKAAGSKAFLEKMLRLKASGLIATHDLSLCETANQHPEVRNQCFEVETGKDELHFDYKLRDGICTNMNATWLMHKMGIAGE